MIKNIVFDVGKVLVDFEPEKVMDEMHITKEVQKEMNQIMFQNPLWNEFDRSVFHAEEILEKFKEQKPELGSVIEEIFRKVGSMITTRTYVHEWLTELKKKGYALYVLSNYAKYTFQQTKEKLDFLPLMDGVVFSYQCNMIKPEQEIYAYLLETYHLEPSQCVFLDDREENILAARKSGMKGIVFHDFPQGQAELNKLLTR